MTEGNEPPGRPTATMWRWILGALVVVAAMAFASLCSKAPDWPATVRWADARRARWQQERVVCRLLPEVVAGSALDSYAAAGRAAAGADASAVRRLLEAPDPLQPTPADLAVVASLAPAVVALLQAARQVGYSAGAAPAARLEVIDLAQASEALQVHGKLLACTDPEAASDVMLAGLQVGADLVHSPFVLEAMVGQVIVERWIVGCTDDHLRALAPASLARLATALAVVDRSLCGMPDPAEHVCVDMVEYLQSANAFDGARFGPMVHLRAWRYGGSIPDFARAQVTELVALVAASEAAERDSPALSATWPVAGRRLTALDAEFAVLDPIGGGKGGLVGAAHAQRAALTRLRLLRLAVAFQARLDPPGLVDPFATGDLIAKASGDVATFASSEPGLERQSHRAVR